MRPNSVSTNTLKHFGLIYDIGMHRLEDVDRGVISFVFPEQYTFFKSLER